MRLRFIADSLGLPVVFGKQIEIDQGSEQNGQESDRHAIAGGVATGEPGKERDQQIAVDTVLGRIEISLYGSNAAHGPQQRGMRGYAGRRSQIGTQQGPGSVLGGDAGIEVRKDLTAYVDDPVDGSVIGAQNNRVAIFEIAVDGADCNAGFTGDAGRCRRWCALRADDPLGYVKQTVTLPHRPFLTRRDRMPGCPWCGHVIQR